MSGNFFNTSSSDNSDIRGEEVKNSGQTYTLELITPEVAEAYLSKNKNPRMLRQRKADEYAKVLAFRKWALTHQGIAFHKDGHLVDGQHRLLAIIKSGTPQKIWVCRGLDDDAVMAMDRGMQRSLSDNTGFPLHAIATARNMMGHGAKPVGVTDFEVCEFLNAHYGAIEFVTGLVPIKGIEAKTTPAPVRAVLARAAYHTDKDKIAEIATVLRTGVSTKPSHANLILLRDWVINNSRGSNNAGGISIRMIYNKTQRAVRAVLAEELLTRLHEDKSENFPLPEEK